MDQISFIHCCHYNNMNSTIFNDVNFSNQGFGIATTFLQICFVLLLRAGFVLIQLSSIPIDNVYTIIYQNIIDIAISIASFGTVGFVLAFGDDTMGVIGLKNWNLADYNSNIVVHGFTACLIATGIITTILAGRIQYIGFVIVSIFSSIIQPVLMHCVWHSKGWMHTEDFFSTKVLFHDHSPGLVIHVYGGTVALFGALFLGRRLILLSEISELSIGVESPVSSITGYIFVIIGLIGFFPCSGLMLINNLMGIAGGILMTVFLQFVICKRTFTYWNMLNCMQGAVAGLVAVATGVDSYTPVTAFAVALGSSSIFYLIAVCIQNGTAIDDYCNIIAVHFACGIIGVTIPPLISNNEQRIIAFFWQLTCVLITISLLVVTWSIVFTVLTLSGFLRNKSEENSHIRSLLAQRNVPQRSFLQRLFVTNVNTTCVEPGANRKRRTSFNTRSGITKEDAADVPKKLGKQLDVATENPKKSRFAYTISNAPNLVIQDYCQCGGDNLYGSTLRTPSSYKLHRTAKCIHLLGDNTIATKDLTGHLENVFIN